MPGRLPGLREPLKDGFDAESLRFPAGGAADRMVNGIRDPELCLSNGSGVRSGLEGPRLGAALALSREESL